MTTATRTAPNGGTWTEPVRGRFLDQPPLGFNAGDTNLYRYVGNDPTDFTDPTGEDGMPAPGDADLRRLWEQRWRAEAEQLHAARARNFLQVMVGMDAYGPQTPRELQLWRDILRLRDSAHWGINEQGQLYPSGTMAQGLPQQLAELEAELAQQPHNRAKPGTPEHETWAF